jgi:hypothetical protein
MTDVVEPLVILRIEVPPKATTSGWGDMSWTKPRC